jgi:minichromosome maintenance protein 10
MMGGRNDADDLEVGPRSSEDELGNKSNKIERDQDTLAIIEKLQPGPKDFGLDPDGESGWENVEPNSRIRLR